MYFGAHQRKWDKNLEQSEVTAVHEGKNAFYYSYSKNKKMMGIDSRDYYEKAICFWENGVFYKWSTGLSNSEKEGPNGEAAAKPLPDSKTTRAETAFNCIMIKRGADDKI